MLIFRKIWCGFIRSIYSSTRLIQSNVAHCGKKLFFLCFPKWIYIQVLPLLCIAQNIDSTLYSKLEETGEWKSYYQGNDAIGFNLISRYAEVDSIFIQGDQSMESWVLQRLFRPIKGQSTTHKGLGQFQDILDAYTFIDHYSSLSFARYGDDQVAAVVDVQSQFKSQIGGILGTSRDKDGSWVTTGEIDLHLENARKQGSIMDLQWQQPDSKTRSLYFGLETPFPFGLPLGTLISFEQEFLEEAYILESTSGMIIGVGPFGRWTIGGKTENGKDLEADNRFDLDAVIIGLRGDRRNNRWMPSQGRFWFFKYSLGRVSDQKKEGQKRMVEADFKFDQYRSLGSGVLRLFLQGKYAFMGGGKLQKSKKVKLGGINSIRGYHENQFLADWAIINTIELLMGDLNRSQLFIFSDYPIAYFGNEDLLDILQGRVLKPAYGIGFRQYDGSITLDISVGFSKSSPGGKLHLKFYSDL